MKTNNSLETDFNARREWSNNRSSAIFPILFKKKDNDLIINFFNYFKYKNNIKNIKVVFTIFDKNGNLFNKITIRNFKENNTFSVRSVIEQIFFEGMLLVEFISKENLRFPFPAISCFFKSKDLFSVVHSAGRIFNKNELNFKKKYKETNWICKFKKNISPFFHYFNGQIEKKIKLKINIHDNDGRLKLSKFVVKKFKPFASKIFFIDEIFHLKNIKKNYFISVESYNNNIFPRMIAGNYFKKYNHIEATHTFSWQKRMDYCPEKLKNLPVSLLNISNFHKLKIKVYNFPTNCNSDFKYNYRSQKHSELKLSALSNYNKKNKFFSKDILINESEKLKTIYFYGKKFPSRFNTSFIYKIKNSNSDFSTDIATGAKSIITPEKYSHWGHGILGHGYDTVIMIRNTKHDLLCEDTEVSLNIFGFNELNKTFKFKIKKDSSQNVVIGNLNKTLNNLKKSKKERIFSWFIKAKKSNLDTIWVSYNKKNSCVLGDHGF